MVKTEIYMAAPASAESPAAMAFPAAAFFSRSRQLARRRCCIFLPDRPTEPSSGFLSRRGGQHLRRDWRQLRTRNGGTPPTGHYWHTDDNFQISRRQKGKRVHLRDGACSRIWEGASYASALLAVTLICAIALRRSRRCSYPELYRQRAGLHTFGSTANDGVEPSGGSP